MLTVLTNTRSTKVSCRKMAFGGRWPSMKGNLWWETTFGGRQPLLQDDLCERRPSVENYLLGRPCSVEDDHQWKTIFSGWQPLVEDNLWWKTTFYGRQPLVEDSLCWKTTFNGRQPLMQDTLYGIFYLITHPTEDVHKNLWHCATLFDIARIHLTAKFHPILQCGSFLYGGNGLF